MDDKTKGIPISRIYQYFPDWAKQEIEPYVVGLLKVGENGNQQQDRFIGSGTLIRLDNIYGILTAHHVAAELKNDNRLRLVILPDEHAYYIYIEKIINVAKPLNYSDPAQGPDLAVIILPANSIGTLKTKKQFYDISSQREKMLKAPDYGMGIWIPCGFPAEYIKKVDSNVGNLYAKELHGIYGETPVRNKYNRGNYDFIEVGINYNVNESLPNSFGGMSGGSLWQMLFRELKNGDIEIERTILSGVIYYETQSENNKRHLICHGRRSIYKMVYDAIIKTILIRCDYTGEHNVIHHPLSGR